MDTDPNTNFQSRKERDETRNGDSNEVDMEEVDDSNLKEQVEVKLECEELESIRQ